MSGGSSWFSEQEIGSKIFSTWERTRIKTCVKRWILQRIIEKAQISTQVWTSHLFSHLLSRSAAEQLSRDGAALNHADAAAGVSQQMGVDGDCQLVIGCCQLSCAKGLCTGVVRLLSAPLQGDEELLQRPDDGNETNGQT